jgi:hypothetical protein
MPWFLLLLRLRFVAFDYLWNWRLETVAAANIRITTQSLASCAATNGGIHANAGSGPRRAR